MATRRSDLGNFYPQRKKGISCEEPVVKHKHYDPSATQEGSSTATASSGSGSSPPAAIIARDRSKNLHEEFNHTESLLRHFDMNMAFGPSLGMTRIERWDRASRLGLNPPATVRDLLENFGGSVDSLWEGRV